jgi:hypothetical protein
MHYIHLYVARIARRATTDQSEVWKLFCAIEFVPVVEVSKPCHYQGRRSVSDSISAIEAPACDTVYKHYIDNLLPHTP